MTRGQDVASPVSDNPGVVEPASGSTSVHGAEAAGLEGANGPDAAVRPPPPNLPPLPPAGEPREHTPFELAAEASSWEAQVEIYLKEAEAVGDELRAAEIYGEVGRIYEEHLASPRKAADFYQRAFELQPHHPGILHACRRLFSQAGKWDMVAEMLSNEVAATVDPRRKATLLAEQGAVLEDRLKDTEGAIRTYESALELWPAEPLAIGALERQYLFQHRHADLNRVYQQALEQPTDAPRRLALLLSAAQLAEDRLSDLDAAMGYYRAALELEPSNPLALAALRRLTHRAEAWESLVEALHRSAEVAAEPESKSQFLLAEARVYDERLAQPDKALMALLRALEFTPSDLTILREIEGLYERNHRLDDVVKVLRRELEITQQARDRVPILYKLGTLLEDRLGQPEEALPCFGEAVRLMPTHVPARQALGRLYGRTGRWNELSELFEMEIRLEEDDAGKVAKLYKLAELRDLKLGVEEAAISTLRELLVLEPDYQPARKYLERLFQKREDWPSLIELYDEELSLTEDPEQKIFLLGRIGVLAEEKALDLEKAQQAYRRILELSPKHLSAIRTLARLAAKMESWSEVLRMYELEVEATEDQKEIVSVLHRAGVVCEEKLQDVETALAHYEKALALNPTYLPALRSLGRIYGRQSRWTDLVRMYEQELEVTRSPEQQVALLFRIADVHGDQLGQPEEAVVALEKVLEYDPENLPAMRELARVYEQLGRGEELVRVLLAESESHRSDQDRAMALIRVAEICEERLDRADRAAELYERVLQLGHGLDISVRALVRIYSAEGMWNALTRALKTALERTEDPAERASILVRCAEVAGDRLHNLDSAAEHLEEAVAAMPQDLSLLHQLERISMARRDWRRALEVSQTLVEREADPQLYAARQIQLAQIKELQLDPPESGAEHYRAALERVPDHAVAARALEREYLKTHNWDGLSVLFEREGLMQSDPGRRAHLLARAGELAELRVRDDGRAERLYTAALEVDPKHLPAIRGRRRIAERREDTAQVLECIRAEGEATAEPDHARDLLFEAGQLYQDRFSDLSSAVEAFRGVLERTPAHEPAFRRLEAIYLEQGRSEELVELLRTRASAVGELDAQAALLAEAGQICQDRLHDVDRAVELYAQVLERDRMHPTAIVRLGSIHYEREEWDRAIEMLHKTLAVTKDKKLLLPTFKRLGTIYQNHRVDLVKAVQSFQAALQIDAHEVECLRRLGAVYREAQDWTSAINVFLRLAEVTPDVHEKVHSLLQLGYLYEEGTRETENAVLAYRKVLEVDASNQEAIIKLSNLYEGRRDWDGMAQVTDLYVRTLPAEQKQKAAPLHLKLADVYEHQLRDDAKAILRLRQALEAEPSNVDALERLSRLFAKSLETYPQAVEAHRRLLQLDPFRIASYHEMFRLFLERREHDKAFVVAQLLVYLQAADQEQRLYWNEHKAKVPLRAEGRLSPEEHAQIVVHPNERGPLRELFEILAYEFGKAFPGDLAAHGLSARTDKHGPRSDNSVRKLADELAGVLSTPAFDLWISGQMSLEAFLENASPPALVVGAKFGTRLQDADQRFLLGRQLERVKGGHRLVEAMGVEQVEVLLWAVVAAANPTVRPSVDPAQLEGMQRRLRGLSSKYRRQLEEMAPRLIGAPLDPRAHLEASRHTANRAAMVLTNDIEAAVRNLAKDHPDVRPVFQDADRAAETIGRIPEVRELLNFAVSDAYFVARARLGFSIES